MKFLIVPIAVFSVILFLLMGFLSVDQCMDVGGFWSNFGFSCHQVTEGFVPFYLRISAPGYWIVIVLALTGATFSLIVTTIFAYLSYEKKS